MKPACLSIAAALSLASGLQAQTPRNPLSSDIKQSYESVKSNLMRAAQKVPEDDFSFKPVPEVRSFGEVLQHAAMSKMRSCAAVSGGENQPPPKAEGKAAISALLKQSFEVCDKAYDSLSDANATEIVKLPWGQKTKLGALAGIAMHDTEQYAILSVYMRLKGIVPPSSEHAGR